MGNHSLTPIAHTLSLDIATRLVTETLATARRLGLLPLAVVVVDAAGSTVAAAREDGCGPMRVDIARGKACASIGMGMSSRRIRDRIGDRPTFLAALNGVAQGCFVPVPGGVLVLGPTGSAIGAVGVSGDASDKDEYCAVHAARAVGLDTEPSEPSPGWNDAHL